MKIVVASANPVKLRAAELGYARMFPDHAVTSEGLSVPSGVADQPLTDAETLEGARNRAQGVAALRPDADLCFGVEGGIEDEGGEMTAFAWVVALGRDPQGRPL
ncbi:MAG: DUF84 family protein, partial [Acidobacteria bacterium]|nr:DUF84 family protein [Acidobacteriota bacterium]